MAKAILLSTGLLLILGLTQYAQSADSNDSSIVKTTNGDVADEARIIAEALVAADNHQRKLSGLFPDAKTAHYFKLLNGVAEDKRNPSIYSFGLGKRSSQGVPVSPYSFGLGKRTSEVKGYPPASYSFGLGKRNAGLYSFGLGKRFDRDEDVWKRNVNRFGFGLGKRSSQDEDVEQWLMDEEYTQQPENDFGEEQEENTDNSEELDVNKRSSTAKAGRAFFPSHLRSAFFGDGQLPISMAANRRPSAGSIKTVTLHQQPNDLPNLGKRLPVYNFGLGK